MFHVAPDQLPRWLRLRIGVAIFVAGGVDGAAVDLAEASDGRALVPVFVAGASAEACAAALVELFRRGGRDEGAEQFLLVFSEQIRWFFVEEGSESRVGVSWSCFV